MDEKIKDRYEITCSKCAWHMYAHERKNARAYGYIHFDKHNGCTVTVTDLWAHFGNINKWEKHDILGAFHACGCR